MKGLLRYVKKSTEIRCYSFGARTYFFGLTIVPLPWKYSGNANYRINASKSGALVCHLSLFVVTMQDSNLHHCMKLPQVGNEKEKEVAEKRGRRERKIA